MERLYTRQEVADYMSVSLDAVNKWIWSKKLKSLKIGRLVRIRESDLLEFVSKER